MIKLKIDNGTTFHSDITQSNNIHTNHVLRLRLGICLQKITAPPKTFKDFGKNIFNIRNWREDEWYRFWRQVFDQSEHWNDKFWLVPPANFTAFDFTSGGVKYRPNIKCSLFVQIWNNPGNAHKNIRVAKLAESHVGDSTLFRSDALTYDSLDSIPHAFQVPDNEGNITNTIHYTIPHEIGHALGQPHVGVLRSTQACTNAIAGNPSDSFSEGGSNSMRCYGWGEAPSISENIMGFGLKFDTVNAKPWQERIAEHTNTTWNNWQVSMTEVMPAIVV
jgi:hypothetical protein